MMCDLKGFPIVLTCIQKVFRFSFPCKIELSIKILLVLLENTRTEALTVCKPVNIRLYSCAKKYFCDSRPFSRQNSTF